MLYNLPMTTTHKLKVLVPGQEIAIANHVGARVIRRDGKNLYFVEDDHGQRFQVARQHIGVLIQGRFFFGPYNAR